MNVIAEIRREREDLARVLTKHTGIRRIVEDLYPDSAHFIYELLQNAEDTGATEASFQLERHILVFQHNGRPFSKDDILAITDIGEGTKSADDEKIGRFGVGFKAVFAYCETPMIWSSTFCFKISGLVLPEEIAKKSGLNGVTRFEFPFNNPKKAPDDAFAEIAAGLKELAETTLLFLNSLASISWKIGADHTGNILKIQHSDYNVEVLKQLDKKATESSHFLKFIEPVAGLTHQNVAIAYTMDFLPRINQYDSKIPVSEQLRITVATPGLVAVFFPAEKESSGLRFHLHAPFVPELSRASIKETPANSPLFEQLASLATSSLHRIRDLGLLTGDFLGVLPNPHDPLPERYQGIRTAIVEAMNHEPLTPVHSGGHKPATHLLQAKASLKELVPAKELKIFHDEEKNWSIGATQKNSNVDRFLDQLLIKEWNVDKFLLEVRARIAWLKSNSLEWHQRFYALLFQELEQKGRLYNRKIIPIVLLSDGSYAKGSDCFFPDETSGNDDLLPRVAIGVYTSGKSKIQQQNSKDFLKEIGVKEIGEREKVEAILKLRYTYDAKNPDEQTYLADLKCFIALLESEPKTAPIFAQYFIFRGDNTWAAPQTFYLDKPFQETGLAAFYQAYKGDEKKLALSEMHFKYDIPNKKIVAFAKLVGVQTQLQISQTNCHWNPDWAYLGSAGGHRYTSSGINEDYNIIGLEQALTTPSIELSQLLWRTMIALTANGKYLWAYYRNNQSNNSRKAKSQLVYLLMKMKWIPQDIGSFVVPAHADRDLLPNGFTYDSGWEWLQLVGFGTEVEKKSEQQRQRKAAAKELGFEDDASLERAKQFSLLPPKEQERVLIEFKRLQSLELPEQHSSNPERRSQRVSAMASDTPDKRHEVRKRSVAIGLEAVKEEAAQYLNQQYTNPDGIMICQACKGPLPFKLDDGSLYFEKVQFLKELRKRHYQNYIALCPNHAAMFQYANGSREFMRDTLLKIGGNELEVVLAQENTTIYFTKTHIADLRTLIATEDADGIEIEESIIESGVAE